MNSEGVGGPDQAIGWMIALACFGINFIMAGLARTAGVLFVALIELYGVSRESASTPFSIRVCVRNMSGPLIGLLGQKYGIRRITTLGGVVAGLGSILCYFAPDIVWITVFWGVIHGSGFGLSTVIHMMAIGQYFDKYKATALGLAYSGDCFGTFAFPVIMEYLLETYDVRGTFLILGGIVLNVVPLALILRKPPWLKEDKTVSKFKKTNKTSRKAKTEGLNISQKQKNLNGFQNDAFFDSNSDLSKLELCANNKPDTISAISGDSQLYPDNFRNKLRVNRNSASIHSSPLSGMHSFGRKSSDISDLRENLERHDSLPPLFEKEVLSSGDITNSNIQNQLNGVDREYRVDVDGYRAQRSASMRKRTSSVASMRKRTSSVVSMAQDLVHRVRSASFVSQIAQDGFMTTIQQDEREETAEDISYEFNQNELSAEEYNINLNADKYNLNIPNELILSTNGIKQTKPTITRIIEKKDTEPASMFRIFLRTNTKPIFILISVSMAVYAFCFVGILTVIIDYAVDNGVSHDDGKYLIIGFSVADLIGRLSFGQIIDRKLLKMKNFSGLTMMLMGILVAVIPLNRSFKFMLVCMCMYGLVQGGTAIMFPILVGYYMEKKEEAVAMGCLNFYGGLLMLMLAPMIGYFRDNTGSYDWVFHIQGVVVTVIGLIWQFEPLIIKYQIKRKRQRINYTFVTNL